MYTSWGFYNAEVQRRQILGLKLALWQAVIMIYKSQTNGDLYKWIYENVYIYLNCRERYEDIIYHLIITCYAHNLRSYVIKPEKNVGLNRIWTDDLCDTGAVLYQLSYQAYCGLVTLWVSNISVSIQRWFWRIQFIPFIITTLSFHYFTALYECVLSDCPRLVFFFS